MIQERRAAAQKKKEEEQRRKEDEAKKPKSSQILASEVIKLAKERNERIQKKQEEEQRIQEEQKQQGAGAAEREKTKPDIEAAKAQALQLLHNLDSKQVPAVAGTPKAATANSKKEDRVRFQIRGMY